MIKEIDVSMLRKMFVGASRNLALHEEEINALNVFPVPDGDTGTNMCSTAATAAAELSSIPECDLNFNTFARVLSSASLRGARGNSGVILSQIYKGMSDVIAEKEDSLSEEEFSESLAQASRMAYKAVNNPQEGTILTVIRAAADSARSACKQENASYESLLHNVAEEGAITLQQTPEMLPVLKKAGVVDAGGMGLLHIFDGFIMAIEGREIPVLPHDKEFKPECAADVHDLDDIEFAYCTEFFIKDLHEGVTEEDIDNLRERLSALGNSLICIGDIHLVKVHVHTNEPDRVLAYASELGTPDRVKIENMLEQNRKIKEELSKTKKKVGIVSVCAGNGIKKIFKDLTVDAVVEGGQTMNPSVSDILSALKRVNAEGVIILPNNKNIILAAQRAAELFDRPCVVLSTQNVAAGIAAAIVFDPRADLMSNAATMKEAFASVTCAQVTTSVRDADMDGLRFSKGDVIGLSEERIFAAGKNANQVATELVKKMGMDKMDVLSIYYGEGVTKDEADRLSEHLTALYPDLEVILYEGNQPHSFYILAAQ